MLKINGVRKWDGKNMQTQKPKVRKIVLTMSPAFESLSLT